MCFYEYPPDPFRIGSKDFSDGTFTRNEVRRVTALTS